MLVVWASGFAQDTETIDFSSLGFSNAQRISKVQGENVTLTFTANGGTAPAYYNSGTAIRMYDNNILNISSKKTIAGIDFELSQGNLISLVSIQELTMGQLINGLEKLPTLR